jgi:vitamin B12 transporter
MPVDTPPPQVDQVVVTAARLPPAPGEAAFSIVRIDAATLQSRERLDEVLAQVPAASLFRRTSSAGANPTTQGLSLRALAPSGAGRALVTLDGVPQNDPFGGWVIWTALPPEDLSGVNVVRGAGAGPYGAGALTGVIALEERGPPTADQSGRADLDVSGGSLGYRRIGGVVQVPGPVGLLVTGSTEHDDGWIPVRAGGGPADDHLTLGTWNIAARAQANLGRAQLALRGGAFQEDRDAGLVGSNSRARGQFASATLVAQPAEGALGWRLQGWWRASDLRNRSAAVAAGHVSTTPANDQYATPATGWGVNAALRGAAAAYDWEIGADLRTAQGEDNEHFRFIAGAFTRNRVTGGATLVAGAYLQGDRRAGPWLLSAGLRADYWSATKAHRTETDLATGAVTLSDPNPDRGGVLPTARLGARYAVTGSGFLRAAAYAGFRPATINELHRPFRVGNDVTESNPALKPERLYGVEAGAGQDGAHGSWSLTAFFNRLRDPVTNVTIGVGPATFPIAGLIPAGGTLRQRQNAGRIDAWGLEGEADRHLTDTLTLRLAGAWTHAAVDGAAAAPQLTGKRPAQAPRLTLVGGADWRLLPPLTLRLDVRYESARFEDDLNTRLLHPATTVALQARWQVTPAAQLYIAADNLLNAPVQTAQAADAVYSYGPPRTVRVGLSLRL